MNRTNFYYKNNTNEEVIAWLAESAAAGSNEEVGDLLNKIPVDLISTALSKALGEAASHHKKDTFASVLDHKRFISYLELSQKDTQPNYTTVRQRARDIDNKNFAIENARVVIKEIVPKAVKQTVESKDLECFRLLCEKTRAAVRETFILKSELGVSLFKKVIGTADFDPILNAMKGLGLENTYKFEEIQKSHEELLPRPELFPTLPAPAPIRPNTSNPIIGSSRTTPPRRSSPTEELFNLPDIFALDRPKSSIL